MNGCLEAEAVAELCTMFKRAGACGRVTCIPSGVDLETSPKMPPGKGMIFGMAAGTMLEGIAWKGGEK